MNRILKSFWKRFFLLLPIPFVWIFLDRTWTQEPGIFTPLDNIVMNWQFKLRGPQPSAATVHYLEIDAPTIDLIGSNPFDLAVFAKVASTLFTHGNIRALGIDLPLSNSDRISQLIAEQKLKNGDLAFSQAIKQFPNIILSATYSDSDAEYPLGLTTVRNGPFPYINQSNHNPTNNPYPETPSYPIIGPTWGKLGLVPETTNRDGGNIPRWAPLFTDYSGTADSLNIIISAQHFLDLPSTNIIPNISTYALLNAKRQPIMQLPIQSERTFYHMGVELLLAYHGLTHDNITRTPNKLFIKDNQQNILHSISLNDRQFMQINWFSSWDDDTLNPRTSLATILANIQLLETGSPAAKQLAADFLSGFKDQVVIIGHSSDIFDDKTPTPFDLNPVPRMSVIGNVFKTIYNNNYIYQLPDWIDVLLIITLCCILSALCIYQGRYHTSSKILTVCVLTGFIACSVFLFIQWKISIHFTALIAAGFSTLMIGTLLQLILEGRQRHHMQNLFGTYVSPELVNRMIERGEEPELGGIETEVTAMFCDIENFSHFSEVLTPNQLVELINEYFTAMTHTIINSGGTLDKYIGDAIVALFGAPLPLPQHAYSACYTAIQLQKTQQELCRRWLKEKPELPPFVYKMRTRIGINTGTAIVGNMGSSMRFSYTMMGDSVNLAARCEKAAGDYGVCSLATEDTVNACQQHSDECVFRFLNRTILRGRQQTTNLYEIVGLRSELPEKTLRCLELYQQGVERYMNRDFRGAITLFEQSASLERPTAHTTNPSQQFIERCTVLQKETLPDDWEGLFVHTQNSSRN